MRLIEFFLDNPTEEFYVKQLKEKTKLAKASVNAYLNKLENAEFLLKSRKGQMVIYKLNLSNPAVKQLKILRNADKLYSRVKKLEGARIFMYGSCARGENTEKSDIDILAIGKDRNLINEIMRIDSRIKVSFYTPLEWSMASRKDRAFFEIVEKEKIRLV